MHNEIFKLLVKAKEICPEASNDVIKKTIMEYLFKTQVGGAAKDNKSYNSISHTFQGDESHPDEQVAYIHDTVHHHLQNAVRQSASGNTKRAYMSLSHAATGMSMALKVGGATDKDGKFNNETHGKNQEALGQLYNTAVSAKNLAGAKKYPKPASRVKKIKRKW